MEIQILCNKINERTLMKCATVLDNRCWYENKEIQRMKARSDFLCMKNGC